MKTEMIMTAALLLAAPGSAAVLTSVDMRGPMVHANVLYDSVNRRLEVHVEPTIPQLTPLDVTNPSDNFAPEDPWFDCLDPSRRGMAFNRQYGFVMDAATDPVPSNMGIWFRRLSSAAGLEFYRYRSTAGNKAWEPILGTAGATNVLVWNLSMFHPAVAAPPATGARSAVFEAFAVDLDTGEPRADIAPGEFTLNWTIVPSARPTLRLGRDLVLRWPAAATNYILECAAGVGGGWTTPTNTPMLVDGEYTLALSPDQPVRLYRLRRVP